MFNKKILASLAVAAISLIGTVSPALAHGNSNAAANMMAMQMYSQQIAAQQQQAALQAQVNANNAAAAQAQWTAQTMGIGLPAGFPAYGYANYGYPGYGYAGYPAAYGAACARPANWGWHHHHR